jgi:hypothetical protein
MGGRLGRCAAALDFARYNRFTHVWKMIADETRHETVRKRPPALLSTTQSMTAKTAVAAAAGGQDTAAAPVR